MKLRTLLLAMFVLVAGTITAHAQVKVRDHRPAKPVAAPVWDSTGWVSLGEKVVQGRRDTDTITVGVKEGRFTKLTLVVADSDVELHDIVVHFGNGETYSPPTRHYFKEGSRTGVIDLPGKARFVKKVVFSYSNLPRRGRARVQLWALESQEPPPPPPPPASEVSWDRKGWTMLGETSFRGKRTKETIKVGRYEGRFDQLVLVVGDNDVEVRKLTVHFANGEKFSPELQHYFQEGARSRVIDLPGNDRTIQKIVVAYRNLDRRGMASVQIWGRDTRPPVPPWNASGWDRLGEVQVGRRMSRSSIELDRDDGRFTKLTFAVEDNDVEVYGINVVFGNGEKLVLKDKLIFREGQRTGAIDLPGESRFIKRIDFRVRKTGRGKKATIVVYGLPAKREGHDHGGGGGGGGDRPWDDRGWTLIGEQEVNGANDTDVIRVGNDDGKFKQLTFVVLDADLEVDRIQVVFKKGKTLDVRVRHHFEKGSRTRVIDLPGDQRTIQQIVLEYGNVTSKRASIQVWGK